MFVATKHIFCHDKSMLVMTKLCNKHIFVVTKILSSQIFVATNRILLWQKFCCDKLTFVAANMFLLRRKYACRDKPFVVTNMCKSFITAKIFCCNKHNLVLTKDMFCVMTNTCLLWQMGSSRQNFFVVTKTILVAAPANDSYHNNCKISLILCIRL